MLTKPQKSWFQKLQDTFYVKCKEGKIRYKNMYVYEECINNIRGISRFAHDI